MCLALKAFHGKRLLVKQDNVFMVNQRKNIMHLIASNFYGGPEKQIVEHLKILDSKKYLGVFASFQEGASNEVLDRAAMDGLKTCAIPMAGVLDFKAQRMLAEIIRENEIDLLCTHGYKSCVMGWRAARTNNIPIIAFSRGYTSENFKVKIYEWLEQRILRMADGIVAVSHGQEKKIINLGIVGKRNWVVHNAVNVDTNPSDVSENEKNEVFSEFGVPSNAMLVVTAGRLSPEKGHRYLVDAIAKCRSDNKEIYYVFCGEGPCLEELKEQCQRLGVLSHCLFIGFRRDLQKIFRAMDLFVLPSLTEGLPNVVLESFACAKPVVATQVGGVPELVKDGVNGLLVPAQCSHSLAEAMKRFLGDRKFRHNMGLAGFETVKKDFGFVDQTRKLEMIYSEILDS